MPLSSEFVGRMYALYAKKGFTLDQVASVFGCTRQNVQKLFCKRNLKRRLRSRSGIFIRRNAVRRSSTHRGVPLDRVVEMRADYLAGLTLKKVGLKYGCTKANVSRLFKHHGFKQHPAWRGKMFTRSRNAVRRSCSSR